MNAFVPAAMNAAIKAGIAQLLAKHPNGLHVNELAKETSIHPQKLGTLMRLLVTNHCFQEGERKGHSFRRGDALTFYVVCSFVECLRQQPLVLDDAAR